MRINRLFTVLAVAFVASACNRPQLDESVALGTNQFNATMGETLTKVSMNSDYSLYWEADDQVSVFASDGVNTMFTAASEGTTTVLNGPDGYVVNSSDTHYAIYPYADDNSVSNGVITTVIPYEQTPKVGSFPVNFSVAKAIGGKKLTFYNVCGLMGFRITRSDIVKVTLKSAGETEYLVGKIKVNCDAVPEPTYEVVEGKTEVCLVNKKGFTPGDYYVAILPQDFSGMTITMFTSDGRAGYVESKGAFTLHRSRHIEPLSVDTYGLEGSLLARWIFPDDNSETSFKTAWVTDNSVPASVGEGTFSYQAVNPTANYPSRKIGSTGAAILNGAWVGDYWLYEVPVNVPANTRYAISFAARVSEHGLRYWMLEYLDGTEWKPIGAVNTTTEPGSSVSYTHAMKADDANVGGTFAVSTAMNSLKIRYRCVSNWKSSGSAATGRTSASIRMSQAGGATIDIYALDQVSTSTSAPHLAGQWIVTDSYAQSVTTSWKDDNRLYASSGDLFNKAYVSTSGSGTRYVSDSYNVGVKNLQVGDCICYTLPNMTLSQDAKVTFMTNMKAFSGAVSHWVLEYKKNGSWVAAGDDNDFYVKNFSAYQYTSFIQSFDLGVALDNQNLELRIRITKLTDGTSANVAFCTSTWQAVNIDTWDGMVVKDKKKVLALGNSFSYYFSTHFMFAQLAMSQGHQVKTHAHFKGSQYFSNHLELERSQHVIGKGDFDYAFLQDASHQAATYYMDPVANKSILETTNTLIGQVKAKSPNVQTIIENTWSYPASSYYGYGSYEAFDTALHGGALLITDATDTWLSPINIAFRKARAAGIELYHSDNKHPGKNGSYLKACVNYLLVYGEAFNSNATDNIIDPAIAAKLRKIAEETVLNDLNKYRNPDASNVVPGDLELPEVSEGEIVPGENGIRTPDQLASFAKLVNSGGDISSYCNAAGEVVLLEDVELPRTGWTPIGSVSGISENHDTAPVPTSAFTGVFDGQGHTIIGLHLTVSDNQTTTCGFFGALNGATVKNVIFEDVVVEFNSSGISASHLSIGTLAGYALNSTIDNVTVYAQYSGIATSTKSRNVNIGGIVGTVAATSEGASLVNRCLFDGTVTNDIATKYANANSVSLGGIVGGTVNNKIVNKITNCTSNAYFDVKAHRVAGIIAAAAYAQVEGCVNNGNITVVHSSSKASDSVAGVRAGGIVAYNKITVTNNSHIKNCTNKGTITTTEAGSAVGGVAGLVRLTHLEECKNSGAVYCSDSSDGSAGLLIGRIASADAPVTFINCYVAGKTGTSSSSATAATVGNYMDLGANFNSDALNTNWTSTNVKFWENPE